MRLPSPTFRPFTMATAFQHTREPGGRKNTPQGRPVVTQWYEATCQPDGSYRIDRCCMVDDAHIQENLADRLTYNEALCALAEYEDDMDRNQHHRRGIIEVDARDPINCGVHYSLMTPDVPRPRLLARVGRIALKFAWMLANGPYETDINFEDIHTGHALIKIDPAWHDMVRRVHGINRVYYQARRKGNTKWHIFCVRENRAGEPSKQESRLTDMPVNERAMLAQMQVCQHLIEGMVREAPGAQLEKRLDVQHFSHFLPDIAEKILFMRGLPAVDARRTRRKAVQGLSSPKGF